MKKIFLKAAVIFIAAAIGCSFTNRAIAQSDSQPQPRNGDIFMPDRIELVFVEGKGDIKDFYIGKYEVTQAQWTAIVGNNPSNPKGDNLPVNNVSFNTVLEFVSRLNASTGKNYRLPTEAEWDFAARGGTLSGGFMYSGSNVIDEAAWHSGNSSRRLQPVGNKKANELGIHDMSGNVREWTQDVLTVRNATNRVIRGGGFNSTVSLCLIETQESALPTARNINTGFRIVLPYVASNTRTESEEMNEQ